MKIESNKESQQENNAEQFGVALSTGEFVKRGGDASAEFLKGYRGVDNQSGKIFAKGLDGISQGKLNPDYIDSNLKQQAGYAAEVAKTSRANADAAWNQAPERTMRSDDLPQYGKNHNVVDLVKIQNGKIIAGSEVQMKFVGNCDQLLDRIAQEDGKFARYRGVKLELPSEQVDGAKTYCTEKAQELRFNAKKAEQLGRPPEVIGKLRQEADNYEALANDVADSGLTTEDALYYRQHPKMATALDIGRASHRAGVAGAQTGAAIGAAISILQNAFAVAQDKKSAKEAAQEIVVGTVKAGAVGYGTAFSGSAIKGYMQQSSTGVVRQLATTSAPTIALAVCLSLGGSINRFVSGEIDDTEFLQEVGEQGAGMLSSSMMAALGQLAIPVPFAGAAIGGMIGYTLSSMFYKSAIEAGRQAQLAQERLVRIREAETAARARIAEERIALEAFINREFSVLESETQQLLLMIASTESFAVDGLAASICRYAELLGKKIEFDSMVEFNDFMSSSSPLKL